MRYLKNRVRQGNQNQMSQVSRLTSIHRPLAFHFLPSIFYALLSHRLCVISFIRLSFEALMTTQKVKRWMKCSMIDISTIPLTSERMTLPCHCECPPCWNDLGYHLEQMVNAPNGTVWLHLRCPFELPAANHTPFGSFGLALSCGAFRGGSHHK